MANPARQNPKILEAHPELHQACDDVMRGMAEMLTAFHEEHRKVERLTQICAALCSHFGAQQVELLRSAVEQAPALRLDVQRDRLVVQLRPALEVAK